MLGPQVFTVLLGSLSRSMSRMLILYVNIQVSVKCLSCKLFHSQYLRYKNNKKPRTPGAAGLSSWCWGGGSRGNPGAYRPPQLSPLLTGGIPQPPWLTAGQRETCLRRPSWTVLKDQHLILKFLHTHLHTALTCTLEHVHRRAHRHTHVHTHTHTGTHRGESCVSSICNIWLECFQRLVSQRPGL